MSSAPPQLPAPADRIYGVGELNRIARKLLEANFPLLWVGGEISNLTYAASGHVYFSLKDEDAQVRCAMWRNRAQLLAFRLANGMRVEARALVTLYEPRGEYQLNVDAVRHAGVGALFEAFARLKERLAREGLFDAQRKRPLPPYPRRIGVVTSLHAAALRDVLAALRRRAPAVPVMIYPAAVQGEGAAPELASALLSAGRRSECDVLILCRGGGSIEDLWAFNDEALARAIAASPIPVVSGIGHETDFTISDFVADYRAATPTAAAELVSAAYVEAAGRIAGLAAIAQRATRHRLQVLQQRLDLAAQRLVHPGERLARSRLSLAHLATRMRACALRSLALGVGRLEQSGLRLAAARPRLAQPRMALDHLDGRLAASLQRAMERRRSALESMSGQLTHLDPGRVLQRGYSVVRDGAGRLVRDSRSIEAGCAIAIQFAAGSAHASVTSTEPPAGGSEPVVSHPYPD